MNVRPGQIYRSNDRRDKRDTFGFRHLRVNNVAPTHAYLQNGYLDDDDQFVAEGRVSRIRLSALGTRAQTGYTLVEDSNNCTLTLKVWGDAEAGEKAKAFLLEAAEQIMDMGMEVSLDVGD